MCACRRKREVAEGRGERGARRVKGKKERPSKREGEKDGRRRGEDKVMQLQPCDERGPALWREGGSIAPHAA